MVKLLDAENGPLLFEVTNPGSEPTAMKNSVRVRGWMPDLDTDGGRLKGWKREKEGAYKTSPPVCPVAA